MSRQIDATALTGSYLLGVGRGSKSSIGLHGFRNPIEAAFSCQLLYTCNSSMPKGADEHPNYYPESFSMRAIQCTAVAVVQSSFRAIVGLEVEICTSDGRI